MIDAERLPTLRADRVQLRWLQTHDVPALFAVFSDPEVMRYWSRPPYETHEEVEELVREIHALFEEKSLFQWGVALTDTDEVVGTVTLAGVDAANRRAELGFALGRAHWGQGLMHEALVRLFRYAFDELGLRRLEADVDPENQASLRRLDRLGFVREGYLRERWEVGGGIQDTVFLGLLSREWRRP